MAVPLATAATAERVAVWVAVTAAGAFDAAAPLKDMAGCGAEAAAAAW